MNEQILIVGQGVIILLVSAVIKGVFSIKAELSKLNGRLGKLEEWSEGHEKLDDNWHKEGIERQRYLEQEVQRLRGHQEKR